MEDMEIDVEEYIERDWVTGELFRVSNAYYMPFSDNEEEDLVSFNY